MRRAYSPVVDDDELPPMASVASLSYVAYPGTHRLPPAHSNRKPSVARQAPSPVEVSPGVRSGPRSNAELSFHVDQYSPPRKSMKPPPAIIAPRRFEETSTSRADYAGVDLSKARRAKQTVRDSQITPVPFEGTSESKRQFVDRPVKVPPRIHEQHRPLPQTKFVANSTMRSTYREPKKGHGPEDTLH